MNPALHHALCPPSGDGTKTSTAGGSTENLQRQLLGIASWFGLLGRTSRWYWKHQAGTVHIEGETILSTHDIHHDNKMFLDSGDEAGDAQLFRRWPAGRRAFTAGMAKRPSACWNDPIRSNKTSR